ncbi:MAG: hypothetical protein ACE5FU_02645 [Nitrospinota bacterium]
MNYSNILVEVGDRVIDDLADDPEKMVSWNSDLLDRWLAADGMMESYIGYLRSQYATSLYLIGESGREKAQAEVTSALRFQKEAIDSMAISGYFDRPAQEIDPDLAYLDIISEIFLTHKLAQKEMFEKFHKLSIASEEFNLAADDMIVTLQKASEEIEKNFRAR